MRLIKLTTYIKFIMKRLLLIAVAGLTIFAACDKDEEASSIEIVGGGKVLNDSTINMNVWDGMEISVKRISKDSESLLYTWASSNTNVVSIEPFGPVTNNYCKINAVGGGEAIVTVTADNGLVASYRLVVNVIELEAIGLKKTDFEMHLKDTVKIETGAVPVNASFFPKLVYKTSDEKVATVDQDGNVISVGLGECVIKVTSQDGKVCSPDCTIKVVATEVETIELNVGKDIDLNNKELTLLVGESYTFDVKITPEDATDQTIKWVSTDSNIATIVNGKLTGVSVGECEIHIFTSNTSVTEIWKIKVVE